MKQVLVTQKRSLLQKRSVELPVYYYYIAHKHNVKSFIYK